MNLNGKCIQTDIVFQDQFEFKIENELNETVQSISYVRVLPVLNPRTLIADGSSIAFITDVHLNASILQVTFLMERDLRTKNSTNLLHFRF